MATSARLSKAGLRQAKAYELFSALHIRHVDNEFYGEPFILEAWQRGHIWNPIFGTGRMEGHRFRRKFRRVLIGLPRDGGKTEISADILLAIASMEPVHQGEYGVLASSKTQAAKAFRKMKSMIVQDADLHAMWEVLTDTIVHRETGARIIVLPYSEAAVQSYHFNACIIDEYHVHKTPAVLEAVISGQKAITNALTIVITTAGPKREGPLWDLIPQWSADPAAYVYWLGLRDDEDLEDRNAWRRVKPMSWISLADMEDQFSSTSRRGFERYTLNRFPLSGEAGRAFTPKQIADAARMQSEFKFDQPFAVGIDGAQTGDNFAIVLVQERDGKLHFHEYVYDDPPEQGYYDLVQIETLVAELYAKHRPLIAIDPSRLLLLAQHLDQTYGVSIIAVKQDWGSMPAATSLVVNAVKGKRACIGGCPKLIEHLANARLKVSQSDLERFTSEGSGSSKQRIDAAIAAAIAMYASATQEASLSFASTGGVWTIEPGE